MVSAEKAEVLARIRLLQALANSTTFDGERANALSAIDILMRKHGLRRKRPGSSTTPRARRESVRKLVFTLPGLRLEYSTETDPRILDVEDGKLFFQDDATAAEFAREMRAWGVNEARSLGCCVVFWSSSQTKESV